jgi:hypothetical protein
MAAVLGILICAERIPFDCDTKRRLRQVCRHLADAPALKCTDCTKEAPLCCHIWSFAVFRAPVHARFESHEHLTVHHNAVLGITLAIADGERRVARDWQSRSPYPRIGTAMDANIAEVMLTNPPRAGAVPGYGTGRWTAAHVPSPDSARLHRLIDDTVTGAIIAGDDTILMHHGVTARFATLDAIVRRTFGDAARILPSSPFTDTHAHLRHPAEAFARWSKIVTGTEMPLPRTVFTIDFMPCHTAGGTVPRPERPTVRMHEPAPDDMAQWHYSHAMTWKSRNVARVRVGVGRWRAGAQFKRSCIRMVRAMRVGERLQMDCM